MNVFNSVFNPSGREGSMPVSGGGVRCASVFVFLSLIEA